MTFAPRSVSLPQGWTRLPGDARVNDMSNDPTRLTKQDWLDALDRAKADIAAGRIVPAEQALAHIDRVLEEMQGQAHNPAAIRRR